MAKLLGRATTVLGLRRAEQAAAKDAAPSCSGRRGGIVNYDESRKSATGATTVLGPVAVLNSLPPKKPLHPVIISGLTSLFEGYGEAAGSGDHCPKSLCRVKQPGVKDAAPSCDDTRREES